MKAAYKSAFYVFLRNPNDPSATPPPSPMLGETPRLGPDQTPFWDTYDTINQLYMEISEYHLIVSVKNFPISLLEYITYRCLWILCSWIFYSSTVQCRSITLNVIYDKVPTKFYFLSSHRDNNQ